MKMKLNHSDFQQMHFTKKMRNIEINCVKCANHHQSFLHKINTAGFGNGSGYLITSKNEKKMEFKIEKRNWKLIDVEHFDGTSSGKCYGSIYTGEKRDQIIFWFDYEIDMRSFDGDGCFESVDVKIYDVEHDDPSRCYKIQLNDRNIKLICDVLENAIGSDPESFGIDFEYWNDELCWNDDEPTIMNTIYSGYPSRISCDKF